LTAAFTAIRTALKERSGKRAFPANATWNGSSTVRNTTYGWVDMEKLVLALGYVFVRQIENPPRHDDGWS
jgi:hypothetical protein